MWALVNQTPYAADRNWTRDTHGAHWWVVAVKASFTFAPDGRLTLANEQPPPVLAPEYIGKPGQSSLRYDSDLIAIKPGAELLLLAHAYAPRGEPASAVPVSVRLGRLEKSLVVYGERTYYQGALGLATTPPRPFLTRPIEYELAYGGSDLSDPDPKRHGLDERNPVGRGYARQASRLVNAPAHAIEYDRGDPARRGPAGFGPIDWGWLPRRKLAGTYNVRWAQTKKPLLPDDYDPRFAMSAPEDQCLAEPVAGGEPVELVNLTPEGVLRFALPVVSLAVTTRVGRRVEAQPVRLTTVLIEPEARRLSLVWQSALRVRAPEVDYLDETEIVESRTV